MTKISIVLNYCYGGFRIPLEVSEIANQLRKIDGLTYIDYTDYSLYSRYVVRNRTCPYLIKAIKKFRKSLKPEDHYHEMLYITEIDKIYIDADAVIIDEYDGLESLNMNDYKVMIYKIQNILNVHKKNNDVIITEINNILKIDNENIDIDKINNIINSSHDENARYAKHIGKKKNNEKNENNVNFFDFVDTGIPTDD
jgi:hypothetical protein